MGAEKWCWSPDDPEITFPDAKEMLDDSWPGPSTGIHEVHWAIRAPTTWAVHYFDDEGELHTKEFSSKAEAEAFMAQPNIHMQDPT